MILFPNEIKEAPDRSLLLTSLGWFNVEVCFLSYPPTHSPLGVVLSITRAYARMGQNPQNSELLLNESVDGASFSPLDQILDLLLSQARLPR